MSESTKPAAAAVDLLSGDEAAPPAASPSDVAAKYSIDDDDDDIDKLEGNYSDDDIDADQEDEETTDRDISALASRTNSLINSYRDYIAEMSNDPIIVGGNGDASAAAAVIGVMESDKIATDEEDLLPKDQDDDDINNNNREGATPPLGAKGFIGQFQDARKGATLYSDFSFKDDPPHHNNINLRAHSYEDDHSFSNNYNHDTTLPSSRGNRGRYWYSIIRSVAFRRFAVGMVVLATIVGMSVGITKSQRRKQNLPDWEGMLAEEQQQEQGGTGNSQQQGENGNSPPILIPTTQNDNASNSEEISKSYMHSALKYHPVWFSREQGWNGQTYAAATAFCTAQNDNDGKGGNSILCPYQAICPAGVHVMPMGGQKSGGGLDESSWVPFGNVENGWTQVGIVENWCEVLDVDGGVGPQWGAGGEEGGEGVTRYVACCRDSTNDDDEEPAMIGGTTTATANDSPMTASNQQQQEELEDEIGKQMYVENYNGKWFDRTSGWGGNTLFQAMSFCGSQDRMVICPYDAYCPEGGNSVPFGGVKVGFNGEQDQWAPVGDKYNEWVSIGATNMCKTLSDMEEELPEGEFTMQGSKTITQHLLCCPIDMTVSAPSSPQATAIIDEVQQDAAAALAPASSSTTTAAVSAEAKQAQFEWAIEAYEPEWYDRSNGWLGSNYGEAINFCQQQQGKKTICPFEAYCPMTKSPGSLPFGGVKSEYSWAPIDDAENWWVQVSGTDTCQLYNEMNSGPPSWGKEGKNELETGYVACCKQPDAGMGDADYYHSSMSDETEEEEEVVIINKDECQDHPTAVITTDGKTCENFISHVGRVNLHNARCSHETPLKGENGETLLVKEVCRLSCGTCGDAWHNGPAATTSSSNETPVEEKPQPPQTVQVVEENDALVGAESNFKVSKYDRSSGWGGSSYNDALKFCGTKGLTLCPYEAYCPQGPGTAIVGGAATSSQWVPFINVANGWIQIGPEDTCMPYNSVNSFPPEWGLTGENKAETSRIMCCETDDNWMPADQTANVVVSSAPSQIDKDAMDMFKPIWYGRKHGWRGGTHQDAEKFCNNIGDLEVCPILALCPDGESLFNNKSSYPGEQWAPLHDGSWAFIGSGSSATLCDLNPPSTNVDRMTEDKKQHIMCCATKLGDADTDSENLDNIIQASMEPTWYGKSEGWNGGSHSDAMDYCQKDQGSKELCPYVAYCPYGEGHQTIPGHPVDFNTETVQWSPWIEGQGKVMGWVMVSQQYQNSATTCMTYSDLEGGYPPWDENGSSSSMFAESKKYILCCTPGKAPPVIQHSPNNQLPAPTNPTPTNPPTPKPSSPPTPKPTFPPQEVKWYPMLNGDKQYCVQGDGYDPSLITQGWTYSTEAACCMDWELDCATDEIKWYPTEERLCVQGNDYPSFYKSNGWVFDTEQLCCVGMDLDCALPADKKWHPTIVDGEKACVFDIPAQSDVGLQFDSKGECCAAFPLACTTTTTTTTSTIPAVETPPCQPSGGKGCHWWPTLDDEMENVKCVYSSDWPIEAADMLYSDHDTCYCAFNDC